MLYLASQSKTRANILRQVGIPFTPCHTNCDEKALKQQWIAQPPEKQVEYLADSKALSAANLFNFKYNDYILAGDQILLYDNHIFDKPRDQLQARQQLLKLRGQTHQLISASTIVQQGKIIWKNKQYAELTMREFSDNFLDYYLSNMGDKVTSSVGAYQWEGLGAQLFAKVEGDFHTILGMPTQNLISFLRKKGYLMT